MSNLFKNTHNKTLVISWTETQVPAILLAVMFIMLTGNFSLLHGMVSVYPLTFSNLPF